jgi:hypothetical protein
MTRHRLTGLLGIGVAAALLFASSPAAGGDFAQNFRGSQPPIAPWELAGRGAVEFVRPEATGLRVTIPAGRTPNDAIGLAIGPVVRGDFDVSCTYEIIQIEKPTSGWGVGFELFIMTQTPTMEAFALERMLRADGSDVYLCSRNTTVNGKREYHVKHVPAAGTTGRLRLSRTGREITAWAAEGDGVYREFGRYDLGSENLAMVRFGANPGVAKNAVDVRIADVKVHFDPATAGAMAGFTPKLAAADSQQPMTSNRWLPLAAILAAVILIAFGVRLLVIRQRRSAQRVSAAPAGIGRPKSPPAGA